MVGKVLEVESILQPDNMGCAIARDWVTFNMQRQVKVQAWEEVRRYVYATDTSYTTNAKAAWRNSTTIPKLCQIRDNLQANYYASLFPKKKWLFWEADDAESDVQGKREAITNYMKYVVSNRQFADEMRKLLLDYIDYGNCIASVEWEDQRVIQPDKTQTGYIGPVVKRWSPLDVVMNPVSPTFDQSPKIMRSLVSVGELKKYMKSLTTDENKQAMQELFDYLMNIRKHTSEFAGEVSSKDNLYNVDGFGTYRAYLGSNYAELLTFYGDIFNTETGEFQENRVITVVDRHKVLDNRPNESWFGRPPIFHVGWRIRQDNLWAMGPLDNLVGMQYRVDQIENSKADVLDFNMAPPLIVKGYVDKFEWKPFTRINVGEEGDVAALAPRFEVLQANLEIDKYLSLMEEMAGSPKEAMGFRTPGEKTAYEVQRMENAASRIFQNKILQFEIDFLEPILNACLELARRNITSTLSVKVFNRDEDMAYFAQIQPEDIVGNGRIRPVAARHFAEKAEMLQNLTTLFNSKVGEMIAPHVSTVKLSRLVSDDLLDMGDFEIVRPFIALSEQADGQKLANRMEQQAQMANMTPAGIAPDDFDPEAAAPAIQPEVPQ